MNTNKSVIVYGPRACGKTRHAKRIAKHFGLSRIIDDWDGTALPPKAGALILTNLQPNPELVELIGGYRNVHAYDSLPAAVRS